MEIGHFYYIDDQYFKDFPDPYLMQNKEKVNGQLHDRPCFYAFQDSNTQLFWMIPFSLHMAHPNGRVCGAKRPKCEAERSHHL